MNDPTPMETILDGMSDGLGDLQRRVDSLETQVSILRQELVAQVKLAAHQLRDDSDFTGPYWRDGVGHVSDHLFTKAGRWLLSIVGYAIGAAALAVAAYWYGLRGK